MSKDPAFLFYTNDFLTGVSDLSMEERGQYITLLCLQHQKGALTDKTIRLNLGSVSVDVLSKFVKDQDGNFYNERLVLEIEKRANFTESRRNNGLKGGRPKDSIKPSAKPKAKAKKNHMENVNENEIIDYFVSNNYTEESAKKFFSYYSESDWEDRNGNKVKNWKQKARGVWFTPENSKVAGKRTVVLYANAGMGDRKFTGTEEEILAEKASGYWKESHER